MKFWHLNASATLVSLDFTNIGIQSESSVPYTGWSAGDTLITQFSDIDSDINANRSDFAGVRTTHFDEARTSDNVIANSSLLDLIASPTYAPSYTVGIAAAAN